MGLQAELGTTEQPSNTALPLRVYGWKVYEERVLRQAQSGCSSGGPGAGLHRVGRRRGTPASHLLCLAPSLTPGAPHNPLEIPLNGRYTTSVQEGSQQGWQSCVNQWAAGLKSERSQSQVPMCSIQVSWHPVPSHTLPWRTECLPALRRTTAWACIPSMQLARHQRQAR